MKKYIIQRTSCYGKKPHKDAVLETVDTFEVRTCSREYLRDELNEKDWKQYENFTREFTDCFGDSWTKVCCRRPKKETKWTIEINDLEKFADENGDIIIFQSSGYPYRIVEIYDDYRD